MMAGAETLLAHLWFQLLVRLKPVDQTSLGLKQAARESSAILRTCSAFPFSNTIPRWVYLLTCTAIPHPKTLAIVSFKSGALHLASSQRRRSPSSLHQGGGEHATRSKWPGGCGYYWVLAAGGSPSAQCMLHDAGCHAHLLSGKSRPALLSSSCGLGPTGRAAAAAGGGGGGMRGPL
jgi:hypothetical protein